MIKQKFEARKTFLKDCRNCHRDRGIWRDRSDVDYYICDRCFSKFLALRAMLP